MAMVVTTHDRQSGIKKQMDLLIMEDLFHKQDISKTFDLKGIGTSSTLFPASEHTDGVVEGRKLPKPAASTAATTGETKIVSPETMFDADWIESMARSPIMLYPREYRPVCWGFIDTD